MSCALCLNRLGGCYTFIPFIGLELLILLVAYTSLTLIFHSVLPLFLVSTLGANLLIIWLIEGIAESTASIINC